MCGDERKDEGVVERLTRERDEAMAALQEAAEMVEMVAFTICQGEDGEPSYATNPLQLEWMREHFRNGVANFFEVTELGMTVIIVGSKFGNAIARKIQEAADAHHDNHDSRAADGKTEDDSAGSLGEAEVRHEVLVSG